MKLKTILCLAAVCLSMRQAQCSEDLTKVALDSQKLPPAEAVKKLTWVLQQKPNLYIALRIRAEMYKRLKQVDKAAADMGSLIALKPNDANLIDDLAT